jgi:EmrB/QacA subfamily drug resistance transporter
VGLDRHVLAVASVVVLGAIMSILDTTIVNVALDTLGRDFHAPLPTIQWVATGYLLALATVIPLTGWAADRFGAKPLWMTSVLLFALGSALCGLAWSTGALIVFRVVQGLGGGMIMPAGQTILVRAAGPQRMGRVMSVVGIPMLLGPILGPVLGGLILQNLSWRWIFFVNLPIGVLALALARRLLPAAEPNHRERLDWRGLLLLSPGLAVLVYGLSEVGSSGGVSGPRALAGLVLGAVLVAAFVLHASGRGRAALLDLALFRERAFSAAAATGILFGISIFGAMILLPLYYQIVRGEGTLSTGLLMAPQGLGAACAMPIAGRLTDRLGAGRIVPFGLVVACLGTAAYTQLGASTSYTFLAAALFVRGLGLGSTMMPAMAAAYQTLSREAVSRATTSLNIIQRVGGSIGTALMAVVLQRRIRAEFPHAPGHGLGALHAAPQQAAPLLAHAFSQTFWVALALTAVALAPALLLPMRAPQRRGAGEPEPLAVET